MASPLAGARGGRAARQGGRSRSIGGAAIAFVGILVALFIVRREDLAEEETGAVGLEPAFELDEAA